MRTCATLVLICLNGAIFELELLDAINSFALLKFKALFSNNLARDRFYAY